MPESRAQVPGSGTVMTTNEASSNPLPDWMPKVASLLAASVVPGANPKEPESMVIVVPAIVKKAWSSPKSVSWIEMKSTF